LRLLDDRTVECLYVIIRLYNKSKHEVNQDSTRDRLFTVSDALVVYLASRIIGNEILEKIDSTEFETNLEFYWF